MLRVSMRLCDDGGMVSDERIHPSAELTYRQLLNNLRANNSDPDHRAPYSGPPFKCTGSAHLAGAEITCTSVIHSDEPSGTIVVPAYPVIVFGGDGDGRQAQQGH